MHDNPHNIRLNRRCLCGHVFLHNVRNHSELNIPGHSIQFKLKVYVSLTYAEKKTLHVLHYVW